MTDGWRQDPRVGTYLRDHGVQISSFVARHLGSLQERLLECLCGILVGISVGTRQLPRFLAPAVLEVIPFVRTQPHRGECLDERSQRQRELERASGCEVEQLSTSRKVLLA